MASRESFGTSSKGFYGAIEGCKDLYGGVKRDSLPRERSLY